MFLKNQIFSDFFFSQISLWRVFILLSEESWKIMMYSIISSYSSSSSDLETLAQHYNDWGVALCTRYECKQRSRSCQHTWFTDLLFLSTKWWWALWEKWWALEKSPFLRKKSAFHNSFQYLQGGQKRRHFGMFLVNVYSLR